MVIRPLRFHIVVNLTHLRYALVLAEHLHFGNAAKALAVSQPALSRAIQSLESSLGLVLFDRDPTGLRPTEVGERVLDAARVLNFEAEDFERETELLRDLEAHVLRLTLGPYPAVLSGHRAAAQLMADGPQIRCRIRIDRWQAVAQALLRREADLGIVELSPSIAMDPKLVSERLARTRGVFCCRAGHPLLLEKSVSLASLFDYPWVSPRLPGRVAGWFENAPARAGNLNPRSREFVPSMEVELVEGIIPIVASSDGIGLFTLSMIERELETGVLVPLPFERDDFRFNYGFVHLRRRTLSPLTLRYMELVRKIEAEIAAKEEALRQRFGFSPDAEV